MVILTINDKLVGLEFKVNFKVNEVNAKTDDICCYEDDGIGTQLESHVGSYVPLASDFMSLPGQRQRQGYRKGQAIMTHEESQFPTTVCRNISDEDQLVYARTTGGYDLQDQLEGQGCLRESRSRLQQNQDYERHREAYEAASWHPRQFLEHQGLGQPEQGRFRGQFYKNQKDSRAPTSGGVRAPAINAGLLYKEDLVYTETAQDQRETRAHMRKNSIFNQPAVDENVQYDAEVRTMLPEVPIRTTPSQAQKTRGQVLGHLALKGKVAQGT